MFCVCVCVFLEIHVLKFSFERCFWEFNMLIGSLFELHVGLHSCLCFSHLEKLFLKVGSTPPWSQSRQHLDTWWIDRDWVCILDSFLIPGGSIKIWSVSSTVPRYLVDRSSFCSWCWWVISRYLLDTSAVDDHFLGTSSTDTSTPLNTFICRDLLAFLYKPHVWSGNHASNDVDGNASSTDEMSTWHSCPLSLVTKRGSSFVLRVVYLRGRVSIRPFLLGGVLILFEGCSEDNMYFLFSFFF